MRRLIISMNITLDGFIAGPDAELDWHFRYWTDEMADAAAADLDRADTLLLGRKTYEMMASYWPAQMNNPCFARRDIPFAQMMNDYRKIVFSRKLTSVYWKNAELAHGPLPKYVSHLKEEQGKNLLVLGSVSIVNALMHHCLIDEYRLWIHPVVLGAGLPFPANGRCPGTMQRFEEKVFHSGVVLSSYCNPLVS